MSCKTENKETPGCIDASWATKQSRTLNDYKRIGHEVAFKKHTEWLKGLGCDVRYELFNGGGGAFRVEVPEIIHTFKLPRP